MAERSQMSIAGSGSTGFRAVADLGGALLGHDERPTFELSAGCYRSGQFRVVSFRGREAISELYQFDVIVAAQGYDEISLPAAILAQPASLSMLRRDGTH